MRLIQGNFPDEVWTRLKAWAREQAGLAASPSMDECAQRVRRIARELTGHDDSLRPDVVDFYAAETLEMISRFRGGPEMESTK